MFAVNRFTYKSEFKMISYFWFRRDLRIEDNHGLAAALHNSDKVIPVFIFDTTILDKLPDKDSRVSFIHKKLLKVDKTIKDKGGSGLQVYHGCPDIIWRELLNKNKGDIYSNRDYEPSAIDRDLRIEEICREQNLNFYSYKDQVIFEENDILKADGKPYTIYTPYRKAWEKEFNNELLQTYDSSSPNNYNKEPCKPIPSLSDLGFKKSSVIEGKTSLDKSILENYHITRDFPAMDATSRLSVQLRFGTISVRQLIKQSINSNQTYVHELIWREFFMMILYHFPESADQEFKKKYSSVPWRHDKDDFKAWCLGQTGYPMVDAGMRELNATGYMHNRVRMITASFLVKHLMIDWRSGEQYFARKLMYYDMSANVGNWQWAAGCGCDAAPYFRVFNPKTQQEKFDPEYKYIKKWIPEFDTLKYPQEIVEHKFARERAISTYKKALQG